MALIKTENNAMPLGRHLAILTKMYYGALSKRLEHLEIEKHYSVLVFIENHKDSCTQQDLCDALKIDKTSMVSVIDYLERKNFIKRIVNSEDRRAYLLKLTAKAIKLMPEVNREIAAMNKVALKGLSKVQADAFKNALCQISANLNAQPTSSGVIKYKKIKRS